MRLFITSDNRVYDSSNSYWGKYLFRGKDREEVKEWLKDFKKDKIVRDITWKLVEKNSRKLKNSVNLDKK
jgi:hypothetical protein